jgi:hypothetical protein
MSALTGRGGSADSDLRRVSLIPVFRRAWDPPAEV